MQNYQDHTIHIVDIFTVQKFGSNGLVTSIFKLFLWLILFSFSIDQIRLDDFIIDQLLAEEVQEKLNKWSL